MKPSIGRIVLFRPTNVVTAQSVQAALIAYVHSDTLVNLAVFDSNGVASGQTSVQLVAPGQPKPEFGMYCEWPHHQVGNTKIDISTLGVSQENFDELTRIIKMTSPKIQAEGLSTMTHPNLPDIEAVSDAVHAAWMASKHAQGVYTRKAEDGEELMAPYAELSEKAKDLDRNTVKAVYAAFETIKPQVPGARVTAADVDTAIEAEIVAKGLTAPRVTPERIAVLMARVQFKFHVEATSTFCHAFLDGEFFLATGHSACVSKENFDAEIGQKIAKANVMKPANDKLWELEGYALRVRLAPNNS